MAKNHPVALEAGRIHVRVRMELREPAAAKCGGRRYTMRGGLRLRRMKIKHRCFEPHGHIGMASWRALEKNRRNLRGTEQQEIRQAVHKLRHGLIVRINAADGLSRLILQAGEGAPFMHDQCRGVRLGKQVGGLKRDAKQQQQTDVIRFHGITLPRLERELSENSK
jgi:hypothetical protein